MDLNPIDVQRHLKGVDYPAGKDELVSRAESNGAPEDIIEALQELADKQFDGPDQVMKALK